MRALEAASRRTVACVASFALAACSCRDEKKPETKADVASDGRVSYLLAPCAKSEHYDVDTAEPMPILVETLLHGLRDPLRRAREELGAMGREGVKAVAQIVDANLSAPDGGGALRNCVDVLTRTDDPSAREPLLRIVTYREQSVAVLAAEGLRKHGRAEDFEVVWALFETTQPELRGKLLPTLHALDPVRAERLYLDWLEGGANQDLWEMITPDLAAATDASVVARCCELWPKLAPREQYPLAAACARNGDEKAATLLHEALHSSNATVRGLAIDCFARSGQLKEIAPLLRSEEDPDLRLRILSLLAGSPRVRDYLSELRGALGDSSSNVANAAAFALAKLDDSSAIERCVASLDDPGAGSLTAAMQALHDPMTRHPELAQRVLERLRGRYGAEKQLPLADRAAVFAAIGQVPLEEAAKLLHEQSRRATGDVGDIRAARWFVMQAGNTGETGARYLASQLPSETDALRRIDLIEGIAMRGGAFARQALSDLLESDALAPYEIVYAADRLIRMGPVEVVAPLLKRVTLRVTQPDVRIALQCLLWNNYPGPK